MVGASASDCAPPLSICADESAQIDLPRKAPQGGRWQPSTLASRYSAAVA
jgi:hypothetical protein